MWSNPKGGAAMPLHPLRICPWVTELGLKILQLPDHKSTFGGRFMVPTEGLGRSETRRGSKSIHK